jgi:hypothetical protein
VRFKFPRVPSIGNKTSLAIVSLTSIVVYIQQIQITNGYFDLGLFNLDFLLVSKLTVGSVFMLLVFPTHIKTPSDIFRGVFVFFCSGNVHEFSQFEFSDPARSICDTFDINLFAVFSIDGPIKAKDGGLLSHSTLSPNCCAYSSSFGVSRRNCCGIK